MASNIDVIARSRVANQIAGNSPCIRNCSLDERKVCLGCGRSLPEILEWHRADDSRQQQINLRAHQRLSSQ